MNRRRFLSKTPLAAAGLVGIHSAAGERLYGQPTSLGSRSTVEVEVLVPHLLRLHYSIGGLPTSRADAYPALSRVAKDVLADESIAARFAQDPEAYLASVGFANSGFDTKSVEFGMVRTLADPLVRQAARSGDAVAFLDALYRLPEHTNSPPLNVDFVAAQEPCCANTNVNVNVTVNITVAGTAVAVAISIAIAIAAVAIAIPVFVFGAQPVQDVMLAKALGGEEFSQDVIKVETRKRINSVIDAIREGTLKLPAGLSQQAAIEGLTHSLDKHGF